MAISTFSDVVDDCVLSASEGQIRLAELTEAEGVRDGYSLDLPDGWFTFTGGSGRSLPARAHFIGTASPGDQRWLWGWHNVNELPDPAVELVGLIRGFGERHGLTRFTEPFQPLEFGPREDASRYAWVSTVIGGGLPHHLFDAGNGTIGVLLLESNLFRPPACSVIRASSVIGQVLQQGVVGDWRRAIESYARLREFGFRERDDGSVALSAADGRLTIGFDDRGRIRNLGGEFASSDG